jgi:hypothetical protein
MKVIWRHKDKNWEIATGKLYKDEAQLQSFLAEYPMMIPFEDVSDEIHHPRIMLKEVELPGSGVVDLIGIDEEGIVSILECKLATNPEIKRKVIGQVLEYASFLWQKPYSFLDEISNKQKEKPLADAMNESLSDESLQDWNKADFVQATSDCLLNGSFRIIVVVDVINDELRHTIEYLTEGPSRLQIYALELTYFASEGQEILVPHLYGAIAPTKPLLQVGPRFAWNSDRFFEDISARELNKEEEARIRQLLQFSEENADHIWWGHGRDKGSFSFHIIKEEKTYSFFTVFSDGKIQFNFGWLLRRIPEDLLIQYRNGLQLISSLKDINIKDNFNTWPSVRVSRAFSSEEHLNIFKNLIIKLRDQVRLL